MAPLSPPLGPVAGHPASPEPRRRTRISSILLLLLLVNLAMSLYSLPLNRALEQRICRSYYMSHPAVFNPFPYAETEAPAKLAPRKHKNLEIDPNLPPTLATLHLGGEINESECKLDTIQETLGSLLGGMETLWVAGDLAATIPLSFVAEKYGARLVLWMNVLARSGMIVWAVVVGLGGTTLPLNAILAGPTLSILGGGECVFGSISYWLVSNLTDDYILRATYFGYMSSISYVVALLGPSLAAFLMDLHIYLPFYIGLFFLFLATIMILKIHQSPLSKSYFYHNSSDSESSEPSLVSLRPEPIPSPLQFCYSTARVLCSKISTIIWAILDRLSVLRTIISSHPFNFSLLLLSFALTSLASSDTKLLPQYISARYNWSFVSAGYLLSAKAVVNFFLLTCIVPCILRTRQERKTRRPDANHLFADQASGDQDNVQYAKICLIISIFGALFISAAMTIELLVPALIVYALGSALPIFTLSLLKSPAFSPEGRKDRGSLEPNYDTHIFSIVMLVKTIGSLLGAPLMAALWVRGIQLGGAALGLPYLVSAACYVLALVVFRMIVV